MVGQGQPGQNMQALTRKNKKTQTKKQKKKKSPVAWLKSLMVEHLPSEQQALSKLRTPKSEKACLADSAESVAEVTIC
jgi:hypothetical protein